MITNYYQTLNLSPRASFADISEAYRKLALRYSAKSTKEKAQVAEQIFNACAEAYQVLSDPVKRAHFDKYGYQGLKEGLHADGQLKGGYRFGNNAEQIFQNFFKSSPEMNRVLDVSVNETGGLFGHAFGGLNFKADLGCECLVVKVPCTLEELYSGANKLVSFNRKTLNSDGRTTSMQLVTKVLNIKPGYGSKTKLHFPREGHQTVHGTVSDLLFCLEQIPHMCFQRKGDHLVFTHWLKLAQSFECNSIDIKTLDGRTISVGVDSLVSPKTLQEVQGEGMVNEQTGKRGSLLIRYGITFPDQLSEEARKQLRTLL